MSLEQALDRLALYRHTRMWLLVVLVIITGASQQARDQRPLENNLTNLLSPDPEIAFTGARNLGLMGGDAWPAFVNLVHVMRSTHNPELAEVCVWAVGRVAEQAGFKLSYQDAQSAAPYVIRGLQEKERRLSFRQASAYTLGRLAAPLQRYTVSGGRDLIESEAVTALTGALADRTLGDDPRHQEFGRTVADALGRFHPASSSAVETVSTLLVDITNRLQDIHMVKPSDRGLSAFQIALTGALSQMGPAAKAAIPRLRVMLQSNDPQAQQAAAYALRNIGPAAAQAAPELIASLENGDANVRQAAAFALGRTRPKGNDGERSVSALAAALGDTDPGVREAAAAALGEFPASESKAALRELTASLEDIDPYVRSASAKSLSAIAEKLNKCPRADAKQVLPRLEATVLALRRAAKSNSVEDPSSDSAIDALTQVEETIRHIHGSRFVVLIRQQPFISSLAIAYVLYLLFLLFVLRFWPTRLLHWNESLDRLAIEGVPLPAHLAALVGPIKVPIRYVLLIGFFRYKSKVLDAWVAEHSSAASSNLARRTTVRARQTYVSLPVQLDDGNSTTLLHLTPQSLHSTCSQNRWCIRVIGEGGSGKTTLACQMARWALAEDPGARLCPDRRAIPILIEPGMIADSEKGAAFRNVIRTQVKAVTGTSEVPSDALLDQLLQTRRVIVILDGASEMEATAVQGPEKLRIDSDFPACALIVTARTIDPFTQSVYTDLLPSRIDTEHLSPFMNAYLRQANLELEDANLFEACRRLSVMVGKRRGITPLLAELYAKALIKVYGQRDSPQNLPSTIPELIVQYLDDLSSSGEGQRFDNFRLYEAAKRAAWECVGRTFRPGRGSKRAILDDPGTDEVAKNILIYLEKQLRLIEPLPDFKFQFALDPIAEYLAALYLVEQNGSDPQKWRDFVTKADTLPGTPVETLEFITAVADAAQWKSELDIPTFATEWLDGRVAEIRLQATKAVPPLDNTLAKPSIEGLHLSGPAPLTEPNGPNVDGSEQHEPSASSKLAMKRCCGTTGSNVSMLDTDHGSRCNPLIHIEQRNTL